MIGLAFYAIAVLILIGERLFIACLALAAQCLLAAAGIACCFTSAYLKPGLVNADGRGDGGRLTVS